MLSNLLACLALNTHFEARGESRTGQVAISEVVLRRVKKYTWPNTPCAVVYQKKQFSWTINYTYTWVDLAPFVSPAKEALAGSNYSNGADHYHSIHILPPDWTDDMKVVQVIGNHIFYRSNYD